MDFKERIGKGDDLARELNLGSILRINAQKYPNQEAIISEDGRATFGMLNDKVNQKARALLLQGVKKGEHISTLSSNCLDLVETIFSILRIGAVLVPLNIRLSPRELSYIIKHSNSRTMIFSEQFSETIRTIKPTAQGVKRWLCFRGKMDQDWVDFENISAKQSKDDPEIGINENSIATIIYTAGTTGRPKGVVSTHKNWIWSTINGIIALRVSRELKSLTIYPLFHVAALFNLFMGIFSGSPLVILQKFDPVKVLESIEKERVNRLGNPPTVYNRILQVPNISKYDLHSVRYLMSGAEVMPDGTRNQLKKVFQGAGIFDNYGMTETCSFVCSRPAEYTESKPYSVGFPAISMEVRVVDEQGKDVPPQKIGEIIVRGPSVMKGYYRDRKRTAEALRDGWLYTQDLGQFDHDGFLYIVERKHNMIISGGENIYPKEVEDVLYRHPKILEAVVYGVQDMTWGQRVHADIVLKDGAHMNTEEVIKYCKQNLAGFKAPKTIYFVSALPRNAAGKVIRVSSAKRVGY